VLAISGHATAKLNHCHGKGFLVLSNPSENVAVAVTCFQRTSEDINSNKSC